MNASFKDTTPNAIRELHEDGICIVMLTGDNQTPLTRSADVWESTRPSRRSTRPKGSSRQATAGSGAYMTPRSKTLGTPPTSLMERPLYGENSRARRQQQGDASKHGREDARALRLPVDWYHRREL
jgi:hypothetical protein